MSDLTPEFMQLVRGVSARVADSQSELASFWVGDEQQTQAHCMLYGEVPKLRRVGLDNQNEEVIGHVLLEGGSNARDWDAKFNYLLVGGEVIEISSAQRTRRVLLPTQVEQLRDKISK